MSSSVLFCELCQYVFEFSISLSKRREDANEFVFFMNLRMGPFKCYVTQMGGWGVTFSGKKRYEGVRFNVISGTRGWEGVQFPEEKKRYVTREWPLCSSILR